MDIEDHPDLKNLRLSRRVERKARAEGRRRNRQALGMPPEPSFLQRHQSAVVAVCMLAALVVAGVLLVDDTLPGVTTEASPSATKTVTDRGPGVDLAQPFLGTPAAGWADGEAGIAPPAGAPVGSHPADQVAGAYESVRRVLIAARLDPAVLEGHDYGHYLELLGPGARAAVAPNLTGPSTNNYQLATRIASGFHLLPVQPKVAGSMSAEEDTEGRLIVHTNYVFAYAFAPADPDTIRGPMDIVTVDHFDAAYIVLDDRWAAADRGLWPGNVHSWGYSIACTAYKRGELAPSYSERATGAGAEYANEQNAFDPKSPMPTTSTCPD